MEFRPIQENFRPYYQYNNAKKDDPWGGNQDHVKFGGLTKFGFFTNQTRMGQKGKERSKRHKKALSLMADLGSESNAHGLAKISTSLTTKRRVTWILLVIIGFTAATLQLSLLVSKYLSFQVVEVSQIRDGMPVEFPSITICNIAAMSLTKVNELLATNPDILSWIRFIGEANFGEQEQRMDSNQAFFENLPNETEFIGHDIENFVVNCRFNQKVCTAENFTKFFDGQNYYNCYTFNTGNISDDSEKLLMHSTGPQNGLSLIVSLDNEDPHPGAYGIYNVKNHIAYSAGVRVQVHAPNTMPNPASHGFDVPPGYSSSVGLKAVLHSRQPDPHGNCTSKNLMGDKEYKNTIYSCLQLCKQKILVNVCQCKAASLPLFKDADKYPYCGTIKNWQKKADYLIQKGKIEVLPLVCEEQVLVNLSNDRSYEQTCGCFQPCTETTYQKSLSLSYWPLEFYQLSALQEFYRDHTIGAFMKEAFEKVQTIKERYGHSYMDGENTTLKGTDMADLNKASARIRQNLLRLNIYLEDLSVVEFIQMPAYELADLFADIGGTLGLWMGISVLTVMELIELIIRLLLLLFNSETTHSDKEEEADNEVHNKMLEQNGINHNSTYDQFKYDRPLFETDRYAGHSESPI